jgi:transposase-like protein
MSKPKSSHRVFSRAFKLGIVNRMLAGEKVRALARELQFSSKDLYIWRNSPGSVSDFVKSTW